MKFPEQFRVQIPGRGTTRKGDPFGAFLIPTGSLGPKSPVRTLKVMACDSAPEYNVPWEHVSVSLQEKAHLTPSWAEMCLVKSLFWEPEECVVQFHPPESKYVNQHPGCLHLWKPAGVEFPLPPSFAV